MNEDDVFTIQEQRNLIGCSSPEQELENAVRRAVNRVAFNLRGFKDWSTLVGRGPIPDKAKYIKLMDEYLVWQQQINERTYRTVCCGSLDDALVNCFNCWLAKAGSKKTVSGYAFGQLPMKRQLSYFRQFNALDAPFLDKCEAFLELCETCYPYKLSK